MKLKTRTLSPLLVVMLCFTSCLTPDAYGFFGKKDSDDGKEKKSFFGTIGDGLGKVGNGIGDAASGIGEAAGDLSDRIVGDDGTSQTNLTEDGSDATVTGMQADGTEQASLDPLAQLAISTQKDFPNEAERLIFFMAYANLSIERANIVLLRSARSYMQAFDLPCPTLDDYIKLEEVEKKKGMLSGLLGKKDKDNQKATDDKDDDSLELVQVLDKPAYRKAMIDAYIAAIEETSGNVTRKQIDAVKEAIVNLKTAEYLSMVFYTSAIPLVDAAGKVKNDVEDNIFQYAMNGPKYIKQVGSLKEDIQYNMKDYHAFSAELKQIESALDSNDAARIAQNELDASTLASAEGKTDGEFQEIEITSDNESLEDEFASATYTDTATVPGDVIESQVWAGNTETEKAESEYFIQSDEFVDEDVQVAYKPIPAASSDS